MAAFRRPSDNATLFIWQTAVSSAYRGHRLAGRMLNWLTDSAYKYVEATVAPSNTASDRFLRAFARENSAVVEVGREPCFDAGMFPGGGHEPEHLYRIGPLRTRR